MTQAKAQVPESFGIHFNRAIAAVFVGFGMYTILSTLAVDEVPAKAHYLGGACVAVVFGAAAVAAVQGMITPKSYREALFTGSVVLVGAVGIAVYVTSSTSKMQGEALEREPVIVQKCLALDESEFAANAKLQQICQKYRQPRAK